MSQYRSRVRYKGSLAGSRYTIDQNGAKTHETISHLTSTKKEETVDYIGKNLRKDGTFPPTEFHNRKTANVIRIASGTNGVFVNYTFPQWTGYKADRSFHGVDPSGQMQAEYNESTTARGLQALQEMSPLAPIISLPEMLSDLIEGTALLRLNVRNSLTLAGSSHLNYNFGWKQLVNDLEILANIVELLEKSRINYERIYRRGGLRTKTVLFDKKAERTWEAHQVDYKMRLRIYATARWVPLWADGTRIYPVKATIPAPQEILNRALDMAQYAADPKTLWDLIPFSWLVDYFTNISEIFSYMSDSFLSTGGGTGISFDDLCIMHMTSSSVTKDTLNIDGITYKYTRGYSDYMRRIPVPRSAIDVSLLPNLLSTTSLKSGQLDNVLALIALLVGKKLPIDFKHLR